MIQTWLPLPSFKDSAESLSDEDLMKQVFDAYRVIEHLHEIPLEESKLPRDYRLTEPTMPMSPGLMWRGCEMQLCEYTMEVCEEASIRSRRQHPLMEDIAVHLEYATGEDTYMGKPSWFGNPEFHLSHQAALVRKNKTFYGRKFNGDDSLMLMWPTHASA